MVDKPKSITSIPKPCRVPTANCLIISPEIRASLPNTILTCSFCVLCFIQLPKAAVNLTTSIGVKESPTEPPIVPLIPEIDLMKCYLVTSFFISIRKRLNE